MKPVILLCIVIQLINAAPVLFSPFTPEIIENLPVKADAEPCDDISFNMCQHSFNQYLNINTSADFHNVDILINDLSNLFDLGIDNGLLKVCQARALFYQCLGARYTTCIDRFHFLGHGQNVTSATAFVQVFNELEFMCNGGLLQSIQKWDCILKNKATASTSLQACRDQFVNNTHYNPNSLCESAEGMMLCYRIPFYVNCGEDVAWWSCEQARVALDIDQYCPHLSCSFSTFGTKTMGKNAVGNENKLAMGDGPTLRTRRELFRSVNPQFMSPEKMNLYIRLGRRATEKARRKREAGLPDDE